MQHVFSDHIVAILTSRAAATLASVGLVHMSIFIVKYLVMSRLMIN